MPGSGILFLYCDFNGWQVFLRQQMHMVMLFVLEQMPEKWQFNRLSIASFPCWKDSSAQD